MDKKFKEIVFWIFITLCILFIIGELVWGITLIPGQIEFGDMCEAKCTELGKEYRTEYNSGLTEINGRCFCSEEIEITEEIEEGTK